MKKEIREEKGHGDHSEERFEAWAERCVTITDKITGLPVPFRLNAPQRRLLGIMEEQRRNGQPVRIILLKARQWGGSTLVQIYMAWIQLTKRKGWNSLICAHVKDASAQIRGMYSRLLAGYPDLPDGEEKQGWSFVPYEKSQGVSWIPARDCRVALTSAGAPNALRGASYMMAHLSEVAFWGDGERQAASDIVRTVAGSVPAVADSVIVMESTADGKDNFFHDEWERAVAGKSDKRAVFVPWHEIEINRREVSEEEWKAMERMLDSYERELMASHGLTRSQMAWYHEKRTEYPSHEAMMAEFPSTPEEAFSRRQGTPLIAAELVPQISVGGEHEADRVIIVAGRGGSHLASLFSFAGGGLRPVGDHPFEGSLTRFMQRLPEIAGGLPVSVVDPDPEASHAWWCVKRGRALGLTMDCRTVIRPCDAAELSRLTDIYCGLVADGRVVEMSREARSELLAIGREKPWRYPLALTRLAAAALLPERNASGMPTLRDLLP